MKKLALPKLFKPRQSVSADSKKGVVSAIQPTVQNWLPVQHVSSGLITRSDGRQVAVLRVEPASFNLLSVTERARRITGLHEAIQALPGSVQICSIPRPIDLDLYISGLEGQLEDAEGGRKNVLRGYIQYVRRLATNAEAMERRFYVLMAGEEKKKGSEEKLLQKAQEFAAVLGRAELHAQLCNDQEVLDLLFYFFHPAQASLERSNFPAVAPLYATAKEEIACGLD